jgi:Zn finger protein HypA/HybF involved in hydrogenase expression
MIFEKKVYYSCHRCGFKKGFEQKLKLYKCPQCEEENIVNEGN